MTNDKHDKPQQPIKPVVVEHLPPTKKTTSTKMTNKQTTTTTTNTTTKQETTKTTKTTRKHNTHQTTTTTNKKNTTTKGDEYESDEE